MLVASRNIYEELVSIISKIMNKEIIVKKSKIRIRTGQSEVDLLKSNSKKIKRLLNGNRSIMAEKDFLKV